MSSSLHNVNNPWSSTDQAILSSTTILSVAYARCFSCSPPSMPNKGVPLPRKLYRGLYSQEIWIHNKKGQAVQCHCGHRQEGIAKVKWRGKLLEWPFPGLFTKQIMEAEQGAQPGWYKIGRGKIHKRWLLQIGMLPVAGVSPWQSYNLPMLESINPGSKLSYLEIIMHW